MSQPIASTAPGPVPGWQLDGDAAEAYERYLATSFAPWARRLVELAGIGSGQRVLDVACGTGIVARQAAASAGASGQVVGLDLNDDMLRVARAAAATTVPPIEWRQGDGRRLPFADRAFDAVVCEQAIQFFPAPDAAVREMHRVLAPGDAPPSASAGRSGSRRPTSRSPASWSIMSAARPRGSCARRFPTGRSAASAGSSPGPGSPTCG